MADFETPNAGDLQAQGRAAQEMRGRVDHLRQMGVQPEAQGSLDLASQALGHYEQQLSKMEQVAQQMDGADEAGKQQLEAQYSAAYVQAERANQVLDQSQKEISTLLGRSEVMEKAMVSFRAKHEAFAPEGGIAQTQGQAQTVQEQLYGVKTEHDANGRPILEPIGADEELVHSRGVGMEMGVEQEQEHGHSLSRGEEL